jgi:hypothetical protein
VKYTGVITAPLLGSGSCPAWMARVSNFIQTPWCGMDEIIQEEVYLGNAWMGLQSFHGTQSS